jgi:hypothetical protein
MNFFLKISESCLKNGRRRLALQLPFREKHRLQHENVLNKAKYLNIDIPVHEAFLKIKIFFRNVMMIFS